MEWKVEDLVLLNQKGGIYIGNRKAYDCEHNTPRKEKIAFVDSFQDGKLSYLLGLIEKFNQEKNSLPHDEHGRIKSVSLKAWIKRNDTKYARPLIQDWFDMGEITLLSSKRNIQWMCRKGFDLYEDWVDELFHRQLVLCEQEERKYFEAHDEYSILKKTVKEKSTITTSFGTVVTFCGDGRILIGNEQREITLDELRTLADKYAKLEAYIKELSKTPL